LDMQPLCLLRNKNDPRQKAVAELREDTIQGRDGQIGWVVVSANDCPRPPEASCDYRHLSTGMAGEVEMDDAAGISPKDLNKLVEPPKCPAGRSASLRYLVDADARF